MRKFKRLFNEYKRLNSITNEIEAAWDNDPENEELEADFDKAYIAEHKALTNLMDYIVLYTGGMIDRPTARLMIVKMPERLEALVNRIA